jgi:hypothetical protein
MRKSTLGTPVRLKTNSPARADPNDQTRQTQYELDAQKPHSTNPFRKAMSLPSAPLCSNLFSLAINDM